jgi:hypothetical protein
MYGLLPRGSSSPCKITGHRSKQNSIATLLHELSENEENQNREKIDWFTNSLLLPASQPSKYIHVYANVHRISRNRKQASGWPVCARRRALAIATNGGAPDSITAENIEILT